MRSKLVRPLAVLLALVLGIGWYMKRKYLRQEE